MSKPKITDLPGGYRFIWELEKVEALVTHLYQRRDGPITGEVEIRLLEAANPHLIGRRFNLQSDRALKDFRLSLEELYDGVQWTPIVEQLAVNTVSRLRQGEPALEVLTDIEADLQEDLGYLLSPILLEHKPVLLFGEGGAGKTQVGALTLICVALPWANNPLGLTTNSNPHNVLVLDWENEIDDWRRMVSSFCRGMGLPNISFHHRRCVQALADDIEPIQNMVSEHEIGYVICDSLGEAAGGGEGNLSENQSALRFFRGLRSLDNVTPLLLHHTSKTQEGKKTPFGSVYFWNMARSVWEIRATRELGSPILDIGLFHRKANFSSFHHPLSYRLTYTPGAISIQRSEIADMFYGQLTDTAKLKVLLSRGPLNVAAIAEETGKTENELRSLLNKYKKTFVKVGDKWGLAI